jgi:hypothetical protein
MELNELLKELDTNLVIRKIEKSDKVLYLYCDIDYTIVKCKYCSTEGYKDILSITVGTNETSKFWLGCSMI